MKSDSFPTFEKPLEDQEKESEAQNKALLEMYTKARAEFESIFERFPDPKARLLEISDRLDPFLKHISEDIFPEEKIRELRSELEKCSVIQEKENFLDEIMEAFKPVLDLRKNQLDKFEEAQVQRMKEAGGLTEINRLLAYKKSGSIVSIHALHGKSVNNKLALYREGMKKLAEIIKNDSEIQQVTATSYLVAEHPGIFQISGFKVEDLSQESKREYFPDEEREVKTAIVSREDFLKRFLKK